MHDDRKPSKVTKKDRYGNQVTYEYQPDMKPFDPTAIAKAAMEQGMEVPEMSMMQVDEGHPGEPKGPDTVPAWLTPGEFVVNAEAMRIPGAKEQIEALNNEGRIMQQQQGGSIPAMGYNQGGQIPAPFIAGPRLNDPMYADGGGLVDWLTQEDAWKYAPKFKSSEHRYNWEKARDRANDAKGNVGFFEALGNSVLGGGAAVGSGIGAGYDKLRELEEATKAKNKHVPIPKEDWQKSTAKDSSSYDSSFSQQDQDLLRAYNKAREAQAIPSTPEGIEGLEDDIYKADGGWVTDELLDKLAEVESGGDNEAVSPVGALGKYQWMPKSAAQAGYGVKPFNPKDPKAARAATKKYLENMQKYHGFTPEETLRAYNWGPGNVINYNKGKRTDIPDEALNYPGKILGIENTQGVTPPPGEAPPAPVARPGEQFDRLSDIPKASLDRYVQPGPTPRPVVQPTPRPVQLTASDIDDLDADINYNEGGPVRNPFPPGTYAYEQFEKNRPGQVQYTPPPIDPTISPDAGSTSKGGSGYGIPDILTDLFTAGALGFDDGGEVPIVSNWQDRVNQNVANTEEIKNLPSNVVPALTDVPGNPMYDNQKPEDRFADMRGEKSWWQGDKGLEDSSLSADGSQIPGPSEEWKRMYDKSHPEYVSPISENKLKINEKAIKSAEDQLLALDPDDSNYDAVVNRLANLKREQASDTAAVESKEAAKNATKDRLNNEEQANLQGKVSKLTLAAEEAAANGDVEKAAILKEQADKLEKKILTTPNTDEGETKVDKQTKVVSKLAKGLETIKDPALTEKTETDIEEAGKKSSPAEVEKTTGLLQELFGDLFDKKELARMAVTYLGGRLLGGSHQGSLGYSAKAYLTRVDSKNATKASNAAAFTKTGKYTPASVAAYAKSGDLADLQAVGAKYQPTGTTETRLIGGKKVSVQQVKGSDGTIGYQVGNKVLTKAQLENGSKAYDPSFDKNTSEYRVRRSRATKSAAGVFEEIFKRDDRYRIGENEWQQNTKIGSQKAAHEFWSWAEEEGLDPESDETLNLLGNAYAQAIQDGKGGKFKPRSLTQYLRQQAIREKSGAPELFQTGSEKDGTPTYVRGDKMAIVNNNISHIIQSKGLSLKPDAFYQKAISEWNKLGPDGQKLYNKSAEDGETGFYVYLNKNLADIAK